MLDILISVDNDIDISVNPFAKILIVGASDQYGGRYAIKYGFTRGDYKNWVKAGGQCMLEELEEYDELDIDWDKPQGIYFIEENTLEGKVEEVLYNIFGFDIYEYNKINLLKHFVWNKENHNTRIPIFNIKITG